MYHEYLRLMLVKNNELAFSGLFERLQYLYLILLHMCKLISLWSGCLKINERIYWQEGMVEVGLFMMGDCEIGFIMNIRRLFNRALYIIKCIINILIIYSSYLNINIHKYIFVVI
jgi:hypothetical protein